MASTLYGGGSKIEFFTIPSGGTFTDASTKVYTGLDIIGNSVTGSFEGGDYAATINQFDASLDLQNLISQYKSKTSSTVTYETLTRENGTALTPPASSTDTPLVMVRYVGEVGTNYVVEVGTVVIQSGTGDYSTSAGQAIKRQIILKSVEASQDLTFVAAMFDGTKIDVTDTTVTLAKGLKLTQAAGVHGRMAFVDLP